MGCSFGMYKITTYIWSAHVGFVGESWTFRDSTYVGLGMYKLTPVYDQLMRVLWVKMELVGSDLDVTSQKSEMM